MDEPNNSMSDGWVELAKKFRAVDKDIRIWVNPGEIFGAGPESNMKMTPYVNCYCPYADHFWNIHMNGDYAAQLRRQGPKFDILMSYTTPCFWEKAPSSLPATRPPSWWSRWPTAATARPSPRTAARCSAWAPAPRREASPTASP